MNAREPIAAAERACQSVESRSRPVKGRMQSVAKVNIHFMMVVSE